ncbi:MAG: cystathionine beta-lyase [Bacteroides sp. SM23_62_1]|nr:MAG: cystathionine beta-lyase [Bacteroides sp. SM23_62_1]
MAQYNFDEIIDRSGTNCIKYDFIGDYFGENNLIPMWVADMDFRTPDFVMDAIRTRASHEILGYSKRPDSFYDATIQWYRRRQNWTIEKEWIIFTPGIVPALYFAVRAFSDSGDKVIIQPPVYHPFFSVISSNQRQVLMNPLKLRKNKYFMDFENLENIIDRETKLLILCHPHNPVGRVWSAEELTQLGIICKKNGIIIISDEIHSDLVLPGFKHTPLASLEGNFRDITTTCIAPSKTFNIAGLSTSLVIIPDPDLREKFKYEIENSHLWLGNIFGNVALEAAYTSGDEWLDQLLVYLQQNFSFLEGYLKQFIPEIKLITPEATYLAWLDMRDFKLPDSDLKDFMIRKAGLACNDGASFGKEGHGFQRMNIACPKALLEKALHQLRIAVNSL